MSLCSDRKGGRGGGVFSGLGKELLWFQQLPFGLLQPTGRLHVPRVLKDVSENDWTSSKFIQKKQFHKVNKKKDLFELKKSIVLVRVNEIKPH